MMESEMGVKGIMENKVGAKGMIEKGTKDYEKKKHYQYHFNNRKQLNNIAKK